MHRKQLNRGKPMAVMALLLLFSGCMAPRQVREVVPEPALVPGRVGEGPWLLQYTQSNLWVRTPSGDTGYALTRSGRVVSDMLGRHELGWTGVAISPDGRQVAYVETVESPESHDAIGVWNLLWVVNGDGSGRRLLVDLRERTPLEGRVSAGPILWSSDGSRVAYVLYSYPKRRSSQLEHPLATVDAVELATGRRETLFQWPERGLLDPRGWSVERGEFYFSFEREALSDATPWSVGDFVTLRLGGGSQAIPAHGALSPDGQHLLLLPSPLRWTDAPPGPPQWDGQELAVPQDFNSAFVHRVAWMHGQPVAYLTTYRGYGSECISLMRPPPALYRMEVEGSVPRMEPRTGYSWLMVLDFSPDDAYVLMAVVSRHPGAGDWCGLHSFESLLVAERSRFESSTSLEQLLATSVRVDEPSSSRGRHLQGFVGWLR